MKWAGAGLVLVVCRAAQNAEGQRSPASAALRLTTVQLRDYGRQAKEREVAVYGRLDDAAASSRVSTILARLSRATAHPGLSIEFATRAATVAALPTISGVQIGAHASLARAVLGTPDVVTRGRDLTLFRYRTRGMVLGVGPDSTVSIIVLAQRSAGDVDGVRVGDTEDTIRARWGTPLEYTDRLLTFDRGRWIAMVVLDQGSAVEIGAERRK